MDALLNQEVFIDFGSDALMPHDPAPIMRVEGDSTDKLRQAVRNSVPRQPGVYGMIDAIGRLVYVGKSKSLRGRLLSYFMPNNEDEKAGRIIQSAVEIAFETQPSEFAALLREQYLIRTFQPRFNVQGIPNRQKPVFLCLGRSPAETFFVANQPDPKYRAWEGPLFGAGRVRRAVDVLNRIFQLRDCSNQTKFTFSDQLQLFELDVRPGCFRHEIKTCLGPCIQGCSRSHYDRHVEQAREFLRGKTAGLVEQLEANMMKAARHQHYEQAIRLRDDLRVITWLCKRLEEHARARQQLTCVYSVQGCDGRHVWYLIRRGVVEHALAAPRDGRQKRSVHRQVLQWYQQDNHLGAKFQRREETLAIVSGWFRKFPQEREALHSIDRFAE